MKQHQHVKIKPSHINSYQITSEDHNFLYLATRSFRKKVKHLAYLKHSYKKRKDNLETRAVLLMLSLELEISGLTVHSIHKNSEKLQLL